MSRTHRSAARLRRATSEDLSCIESLFDQLTSYSMAVDGVTRRREAAEEFLSSVPPRCDAIQKQAFLVFEDDTPVGLVDLIAHYPDKTTAFIGLLAVVEPRQGRGLGRQTYIQVETLARTQLDALKLRLAVVSTNPVAGFWQRMGFAATNEYRPYKGKASDGVTQIMEKALIASEI